MSPWVFPSPFPTLSAGGVQLIMLNCMLYIVQAPARVCFQALLFPCLLSESHGGSTFCVGCLRSCREARRSDVPLVMNPYHPARSVEALRAILSVEPTRRQALAQKLFR